MSSIFNNLKKIYSIDKKLQNILKNYIFERIKIWLKSFFKINEISLSQKKKYLQKKKLVQKKKKIFNKKK